MDRVVFVVAANKFHSPEWTVNFAQAIGFATADPDIQVEGIVIKSTALPGHNKSDAVDKAIDMFGKRRLSLTDTNRNAVVEDVLENTQADWLYWWDDDTEHPAYTLRRMLNHQKPFVSGVYYLKRPPCPPVAYFRNDNGTYSALSNFRKGEILQVDSVGMGCALIHRSVYEAIQDTHSVWRRHHGGLYAAPKAHHNPPSKDIRILEKYAGQSFNGFRVERVDEVTEENWKEQVFPYPYYVLEYGRTEDHYFCELAAHAGHKPVVDTNINCKHWGERPVSRQSFKEWEIAAKREQAALEAADEG